MPWVNRGDTIKWSSSSRENIIKTSSSTTSVGVVNGNNLDAAKALHFASPQGILQLENSINHGAGALFFNSDFTVRGKTGNETWIGAGVSVNDNKTVHWQVKNPVGDRLSKIGNGTLYINGQGVNPGDISIGAGTVILDQQPDSQGHIQAFNQVSLVSGRATLRIANSNQFDTKKFYFGFRGGRLDLNGNTLNFEYIQNTDDGARITNNNPDKSSDLIITGFQPTKKDIFWQKWEHPAVGELTLYEYKNQHHRNRLDYFHLTKDPKAWFPTNAESDANWEFLGHDKAEAERIILERNSRYSAFDGYLGETDSGKHNGRLNVIYNPVNQSHRLLLSGGTRLNGDFKVNGGEILLSGKPLSHTHNFVTGQNIVKDNEWVNRQFSAENFSTFNNATLYIGRNVSQVNGTLNAFDNSTLSLGFIDGKTPSCIRTEYTGKIECSSQTNSNNIPKTQINGTTYIRNHANLEIGNAHLTGYMFAYSGTNTTMYKDSQLTLAGGSHLYNLQMDPGSEITLNTKYHTLNSNEIKNGFDGFNTLDIFGNLSGAGHFNFISNAKLGRGDLLLVHGPSSGSFSISLKNTGAEPNKENPLTLVRLMNHNPQTQQAKFTLADRFVDLGAYRYVLAKSNNEYHLYNPILSAANNIYPNGTQLDSLQLKANSNIRKKAEQLCVEHNVDLKSCSDSIDLESIKQRLVNDITNKEQERKTLSNQIASKENEVQKENTLASKHEAASTKWYYTWTRRNKEKALADEARQRAQQLQNEANQLKDLLQQKDNELTTLRKELASINSTGETRSVGDNLLKATQTESRVIRSNNIEKDFQDAKNAYEKAKSSLEENRASLSPEQIAEIEAELKLAQNALDEMKQAIEIAKQYETGEAGNPNYTNKEIPVNAQSYQAYMRQADLISQFANTALSDLSAQANNLRQIRQALQRQLVTDDKQNFSVWANYNHSANNASSDLFRAYEQKTHLTQIGVEGAVADSVRIGAVFSQAKSNNQFDDNFSGKSRLNMLTLYSKFNLPQDINLAIDASYGQAKNRLSKNALQSHFKRHIYQAGLTLSKKWDLNGVEVQPSASVHYNRFNGVSYNIDEANIRQNAINFMSYHAGLKLAKTFDVGQVKFTPSIESQYVDFSHKNVNLLVNNYALKQKFARGFNHEIGLNTQFKQLAIQINAGLNQSNQARNQKQFGLNVKYQW